MQIEPRNTMSAFNQFAFQQLSAIVADEIPSTNVVFNLKVITFTHEMLHLGYELLQDAYIYLTVLGEASEAKCEAILKIAKATVGVHKKLAAFYPNFPKQVMEANEGELFFNAALHYWTLGTWKPSYVEEKRDLFSEQNSKTKLRLIKLSELKDHFFKVLQTKSALSPIYYEFIDAGLQNNWYEEFVGEIAFKEVLCRVAIHNLKNNKPIKRLVRSATDVLRVMVALSENTGGLDTKKIRFKSLKREMRRTIVEALDGVITRLDVKLYGALWIRAFHSLHVGEFKGASSKIAFELRNNKSIPTEETLICEAIKHSDTMSATNYLLNTPSVFLRHIDKLLRDSSEEDARYIVSKFALVVDKIDSKLLLQLSTHLKGRVLHETDERVVFTKGVTGRVLLAPPLKHLNDDIRSEMNSILMEALIKQFKKRGNLEGRKVYIDPLLKSIPLPSQLASALAAKKTLYRGSQVSLINTPTDKLKNTIRLFVHWIGRDIDLSALFVTDSLDKFGDVSYQNLKTDFCFHSGDITSAPSPEGATEFIDIDIDGALKAGYRYACMDIRVFLGPQFVEHEECFAGFMFRERPQSGEIFEPSSVVNKFDVVAEATTTVACAFDMLKRKIIWMDTPISRDGLATNNLRVNAASSVKILKAYLDMKDTRVSMYELMKLHADAVEAEVVDSREEADCVVGFGDGDVDTQDIADILARWI